MSPSNQYVFSAGEQGEWRVAGIDAVRGEALPAASRLRVLQGLDEAPAAWRLRGFTSNTRYTTRTEAEYLRAVQPPLGRPGATLAALIPIRKSARWWDLAQDERRRVFEESSRHIAIGLDYLPAVARRLHHSRDLGEPFDFLTWFEYAPVDAAVFDELLRRLRATPEWGYVEREVDVRLER